MPQYPPQTAIENPRRRQKNERLDPARTLSTHRRNTGRVRRHDGSRIAAQQRLLQRFVSPIEHSIGQANYRTDDIRAQSPIDGLCIQDHRHSGYDNYISDRKAAFQMEEVHLQRRADRRVDRLTERILRSLIVRREALDDAALNDLLDAADQVFFDNTLSRVRWCWSAHNDHSFNEGLLGTTRTESLQDSQNGHPDLIIILSRPLLACGLYSRDLLLSAFFHELIHCYLFIICGLKHAQICDGHTEGFKLIAGVIERWIGDDRLHLSNMRARLEDFSLKGQPDTLLGVGGA